MTINAKQIFVIPLLIFGETLAQILDSWVSSVVRIGVWALAALFIWWTMKKENQKDKGIPDNQKYYWMK